MTTGCCNMEGMRDLGPSRFHRVEMMEPGKSNWDEEKRAAFAKGTRGLEEFCGVKGDLFLLNIYIFLKCF